MIKVNKSDHVIIGTNPLSAGWLAYRPFGSLGKYTIVNVQGVKPIWASARPEDEWYPVLGFHRGNVLLGRWNAKFLANAPLKVIGSA